MNTFNLGTWKVFDPSHQQKDKWQALKVLEEAAEVVEAAKQVVITEELQSQNLMPKMGCEETVRRILANEIADLLQTITNLCDAYNISEAALSKAKEWCNLKSTERGMFEPGSRTHMHREEDADD
ncbi:MAG: hypothetical protein K2I40_05490 [Bifidobacterium castoris]|nr:hypothetical protein [Bifidobacterium castoris]